MRKVLFMLMIILTIGLVSSSNKNEDVDAISGLGYDGYKKMMEEFNNKN